MKKLLLLSAVTLLLSGVSQKTIAQRYLTDQFTDVSVTSNVTYAQNYTVITGSPVLQPLMMDVYQPVGDSETERALVIYIHTGSFLPQYINGQVTGNKNDSTAAEMCRRFARKGYVAVSMDYRMGWNPLGSGAEGEDIRRGTLLNAVFRAIQDAKACVRYMKKEAGTYKIDTTKIIIGGQGSGGYVAFAYASLNKQTELQLPKFISSTNVPAYGFTAGQPYVNTATLGNWDGTGGIPQLNSTGTVNLGHTNDVSMVFNMGGALGDSLWVEAGDVPAVALHVKTDPFAPYTYGPVIVPTTGEFVVNVYGSRSAIKINNDLANNDILNGTYTDAVSTRQAILEPNVKNVYPFTMIPTLQAGPWEWWDSVAVKAMPAGPQTGGATGAQIHANSMKTNPDMSKTKAMAYIDTCQEFITPRAYKVVTSTSGVKGFLAGKDAVRIYPNPSNGDVRISIPSLNGRSYQIEIYDMMGKLVRRSNIIREENYAINRSGLLDGVYLVKISCDGSTKTEKMILY